ncbi:pilus assembly protein [Pseudohoeflea suaedae]|uniref:Pilus assembly protein n=1 Tax=Pseudohoeflea suaedae TaxID=877384 RepID=A0A4R5PNZ1_9HYPH|nr:TadE/TadG family type IV pilus assembly protein [Pseudohoeflea suaedae]TDH38709.1 pilus assembly protein [Pseudohoeflea suaedae]
MLKRRCLLRDTHGTAAIEFAIVAPLFILILLSLVGYGIYLSVAHSVQQLAADAARASIAGLSEAERQQLANSYIHTSKISNGFLDQDKLAVRVEDDTNNSYQFTVTLTYDASDLPIWSLYSFAMPGKEISRYSTIRVGGV